VSRDEIVRLTIEHMSDYLLPEQVVVLSNELRTKLKEKHYPLTKTQLKTYIEIQRPQMIKDLISGLYNIQ